MLKWTAFFMLWLMASTVYAATQRIYIVKQNDSLWRVAKKEYRLKTDKAIDSAWRKIAIRNGLTDPDKIRAGQRLIIPAKNSEKKIQAPPGYEYAFTKRTKTTAYCKCAICCQSYADGKTSIGDNARIINGVAADPRAIAYRSKVYIPGVGFKEVDDTGGRMRQSWSRGIYHLDVRFANHRQAKAYGTKWRNVIYFRKKDDARLAMYQ